MASFCRSAITAGSRSLASRSKTLTLKSLTPKPMSSPFSSPSTRALPCAARIVSVLGGVESMMPLHSAIASARLKSSIAVDSSCWSWLSQGMGKLELHFEQLVVKRKGQREDNNNAWGIAYCFSSINCHSSLLPLVPLVVFGESEVEIVVRSDLCCS
ncbi:hypothetical protein PTKIN_Ptkin10aG0144500 [Pterospermum kingtungense]